MKVEAVEKTENYQKETQVDVEVMEETEMK